MNKRLMVFCSFLLIIGSFGIANALTITYTDFSDLSDFTLNNATNSINTGGSGVIGPDGSKVLRLTNNTGQSGSAFLTDAILLEDANGFEASFSTAFDFQFTDQQNGGADGIVFVIQTNANTAGGSGGGIGYYGIDNSVGIEFDNWHNGENGDISGSHVGINLDGSVNSVVQADVSPSLDNQNIWHAWVDYDGTADLLEVRLSTLAVRPELALLSYDVDLVSVLGQSSAFVGFTSGTGWAGADHDIRAWQFTNTLKPIENIDPVPEPTTMLLLGAGLLGWAGARRKMRT